MFRFLLCSSFILISCFLVSQAEILNPHFVLTKLDRQKANVPHRRTPRDVRRQSSGTTIERFHVLSHVTSRYSRVTVTSDVRNDNAEAGEVGVELRLPKSAFISNFSMEIDSVTYVGVVKEKKAAKAQYEAAVARGESAGLVSAKSREVQSFAVSVNVAAGGAVTFRLDYQELLFRKLGKYNHAIYVDPGQPVSDMKVEVEIREPSGITTIAAAVSTSEKKKRKRQETNLLDNQENVLIRRSSTQAYIRYTPTLAQQRLLVSGNLPFVVSYDVKRETLGGEILIKDGYFVHFFAPQRLPVIPKNIVFVIDRSGSMYGKKIRQTIKAFKTILGDLGSEDKFNIITFSSESEVWQRNEMMEATPANIRRGKRFVQNIHAQGGTNFYGATMDAIGLLDTISDNSSSSLEQAYMMILLTDGQPTVGITDTERIRSDVAERVNGKYSVFCLGFGTDLDHAFLQSLANENKGLSRQIYRDSDAVLQLKGFYDEVASPLLAHVIMKYSGVPVVDTTELTFDNYFDGSEIIVAGRMDMEPLETDEPEVLGLQSLVEARSVNGDMLIEATGKEIEETFAEGFDMEKLWAYLTIKELLKNKTLLSDNQIAVESIDQEILRLSLKFNFVTPLTSMVVTKPDQNAVVDDEAPRPPPPRPLPHSSPRVMPMFSRILSSPGIHSQRLSSARSPSGRRYKSRMRKPGSLSRMLFSYHSLRRRPSYRKKLHKIKLTTSTTTATTTTTTPLPPVETTTPYVNPHPENPLDFESWPNCGEEIVLETPVNITSPRFPGLYPSNAQCVWQINLPEEENDNRRRNITITFSRFDLEEGSCNRDRVIVYPDFDTDRSRPSQALCGFNLDENVITAFTNIVVVFQSDNIVSGRGFLANLNLV